MFKVPFYGFQNYQQVIGKSYEEQERDDRVDLQAVMEVMTSEFVDRFANVDARSLGQYLDYEDLSTSVEFGGKYKSLEEVLVAMKLLMPSLWTTEYFLWKEGRGSHTGIDIILPKGTPIHSFSGGKVVRIKERDGQKKDEGNCVVVQEGNKYYSYKHLHKIDVEYGEIVSPSMQLGTCGSTGYSTQYHLHFQIDSDVATFHPYWSAHLLNVQKNTEDPMPYLRDFFAEVDLFWDMPDQEKHRQAIKNLHAKGIIKGFEKKIYPHHKFPRRQLALVVDRLANKYSLYSRLPIVSHEYLSYSDEPEGIDPELPEALKRLQKHGIMRGHQGRFYPQNNLKAEEWLAVLGRLFYRIENSESGVWYDSYVHHFRENDIIDHSWNWIGQDLDRKEVFLILDRVVERM